MRSGPSTAPRPSSTAASTAPGAREKMGRARPREESCRSRSSWWSTCKSASSTRWTPSAATRWCATSRSSAPPPDGSACRCWSPSNTPGGSVARSLSCGPFDDVAPLDKTAFLCCSAEGFTERLRGLRPSRVILTGIEAHVCVLLTALDLLGQGFAVSVVADAVSSRTPANLELGLAQARQGGAVVTATETVVFQLLGRADTDAFREIAKLLK